MKYGFIGCGNMAKAIIAGILNNGAAEPDDILASAPSESTRKKAEETFGIAVTKDNIEVAGQAEILFLCVKPVFLGEVVQEIRSYVPRETLIVSIVAGRSITDLEILFDGEEDSDRKIVRIMPNTPAMVGEGMSAVCANANVTDEDTQFILKLFSLMGRADLVPERLFDAVSAVSGSSPAYVFLFLEALADGGVEAGLPRDKAYEFAAQSVLGSAKMLLDTGLHPGELKDMVCSPGGTTIEAVRVLEDRGFRGAVIEAVRACCDRSRNM